MATDWLQRTCVKGQRFTVHAEPPDGPRRSAEQNTSLAILIMEVELKQLGKRFQGRTCGRTCQTI